MAKLLPLTCLALLAVIPAVLSCRCALLLHTQDAFCDPNIDFVIKAKVKKITTLANEIKYKIKTLTVFKASPAYNALSNQAKKFLWSLLGGSLCQATLVKTKYVVTGKVGNGKLMISSCQWIQKWSDLNSVEKQNLQTNYAPNCACSFNQVGGAPPQFPFLPTECVMISTQVSCGRLTWCKCANPGCTSCTFQQSQAFQNCNNQFPFPP